MYQSFKLLKGTQRGSDNLRPHDYLDDLESFFYVLCHVCFLYNGGKRMDPFSTHDILADWNDGKPAFKLDFMMAPGHLLSPYIHKSNCATAFYGLFIHLQKMFSPVLNSVARATGWPPAPMKRLTYEEHRSFADKSCSEFLGHVDAAINEIEQIRKDLTSAATTTSAPPSPLPVILGSASSQPSPSSALLPLPSAYPSSSSSQSSKRRLSTTSLPDAEQDKTEAGGGDRDAGHEVYLHPEGSGQADRKRVKGE